VDNEDTVKFWKPSGSRSGSTEFLKEFFFYHCGIEAFNGALAEVYALRLHAVISSRLPYFSVLFCVCIYYTLAIVLIKATYIMNITCVSSVAKCLRSV